MFQKIILILIIFFSFDINLFSQDTYKSNLIEESIKNIENYPKDKIDKLIYKIQKASHYYSLAKENLEKGNTALYKKNYKEAFNIILDLQLDNNINFLLQENLNSTFSRLNNISNIILSDINILNTSKEAIESPDDLNPQILDAILEEPYAVSSSSKSIYFLKSVFYKENDLSYPQNNPNFFPINTEDPAVKIFFDRTTKDPKAREVFNNALERYLYYSPMITRKIKEMGLPMELIYLPLVESLYKVNAISSSKALGLWQFMAITARGYNLKVNYWIDERLDPEKATIAALNYLKCLHDEWFDDWYLAIAAYNRGHSGIGRDLLFSKATNFKTLKERDAIPKETENYVPKFMAFTAIASDYKKYNFNPKTDKTYSYDVVIINKSIDLEIAAKCAGITIQELKEFNPSILAWCTPPNYQNFELKLPLGSGKKFVEEISKIQDMNPSRGFIKYIVKKGDHLLKLAKLYDTSINDIKEDNKLKTANLSIGKVLVIKPGRKYISKN